MHMASLGKGNATCPFVRQRNPMKVPLPANDPTSALSQKECPGRTGKGSQTGSSMSEPDSPSDRYFLGQFRKIAEGKSSSFMLAGLFVLAVLYTLFFARAVLLPIVLASLLALILMPAVRVLSRVHVPRALGAAVVVATLLGAIAGLVSWIYDPATQWIEKAPSTIAEVERKMRG